MKESKAWNQKIHLYSEEELHDHYEWLEILDSMERLEDEESIEQEEEQEEENYYKEWEQFELSHA